MTLVLMTLVLMTLVLMTLVLTTLTAGAQRRWSCCAPVARTLFCVRSLVTAAASH
jgi:hypothetical protein